MSRIQDITRLTELFPKYKILEKNLQDNYIPQMEDKYYGSPIKEAFASFFRGLKFTKVSMTQTGKKLISLYRANLDSFTVETRYYVIFVIEKNPQQVALGTYCELSDLLPFRWIAFQSGESMDEGDEFNEYRSAYSKKTVSNPYISKLQRQVFNKPDIPSLLKDRVARYKVTDTAIIYHNLMHAIDVILLSQKDLTVAETNILMCLDTFKCIVKFLNG